MPKWWVALSLGVAFALVAAGCGQVGPDDTGPTSSSHHLTHGTVPVAAPGRTPAKYDPQATITYGLPSDPTNWNPLSAAGAAGGAGQVAAQVWPSVYTFGPKLQPVLNTSLVLSAQETSTDPQTVVYHINSGAHWSDGTPITYQDFVYNWEAQSGSSQYTDVGGAAFTPASTAGYSTIASVTGSKSQPDVVTVVWRTPYPDWQTLFSDLVPAHVAEKVGFDKGFTDPVTEMVSGGPYVVQSYQPGTSVTLVRNPGYWGSPAGLASITYELVPDQPRLVNSLVSGDVDAAPVQPDPTSIAELKSAPTLAGGSTLKLSVTGGSTYEDLELNEDSTWLRDPALRHAVMLAIDRPSLINQVESQLKSYLSPVGNRFVAPSQPGYKDDSGGQYNKSNVSQAKQVLTAAGYSVGPAGLTLGGARVTLTLASGVLPAATPSSSAPTILMREQEEAQVVTDCAAIGVAVTVVPATPAGTWDMQLVTRTLAPDPAAEAPAYEIGGAANDDHYASAAMDRLLAAAAAAAPYTTAAATRYDAADAQAWSDYVDLPLFQLPVVVAYASNYLGVAASASPSGPVYDEQDWGVEDTT